MSAGRILILGAGYAQADAVRLCRDLGLEVHCCGRGPRNPARRLASGFADTDVRDVEGVLALARGIRADLVYSVGSDAAMPAVAEAGRRLRQPCFLTTETARACGDKVLLRRALGEGFRGNIRFREVRRPADLAGWRSYPCVLKPVDSQGQRGVFMPRTPREAAARFAEALAHSPSGRLVVEEFVAGPEFSLNLHLRGGSIAFCRASERLVHARQEGGIVRGHVTPARLGRPELEQVLDLAARALARVGLREGPAYLQVKLSPGGPRLVELAPRLDGCHLWRLIRLGGGPDLLETAFADLLGLPDPLPAAAGPVRPLLQVFMCARPGARLDKAGFALRRSIFAQWYFRQGQVVPALNGRLEKAGYRIEAIP